MDFDGKFHGTCLGKPWWYVKRNMFHFLLTWRNCGYTDIELYVYVYIYNIYIHIYRYILHVQVRIHIFLGYWCLAMNIGLSGLSQWLLKEDLRWQWTSLVGVRGTKKKYRQLWAQTFSDETSYTPTKSNKPMWTLGKYMIENHIKGSNHHFCAFNMWDPS